jgi:hypothetical protein
MSTKRSDKKNRELQSGIDEQLDRRLMEEINILRLEGSLFCFDAREAKRRGGRITLRDARNEPLTIDVNPNYGQPSVLAYKVLQAIFLKITEEGVAFTDEGRAEYVDTVSFSQRELAGMVGRAWSGRTSAQLYDAVMQLQATRIVASFKDKETDEWKVLSFVVVPSALFSGRGETLTQCSVRLATEVVASINKRHVAFFNLQRLNMLEPIGVVLYKRLFYHFATLNRGTRRRSDFTFSKDYGDLCNEWLGRLKTRSHLSLIKQQFKPHLDQLKATRLISRWEIEKSGSPSGFKITFWAGKGFFDDYELYYLDRQQPRLRFKATADVRNIQKPLELVAHFHGELGRDRQVFEDQETAYADELLTRHDETEIRDLIRYAVTAAKSTQFDMLYFSALKVYESAWAKEKEGRMHRNLTRERIEACPYCNESGFLELRERHTRRHTVHECPHSPELIAKIEEEKGLERL